METINLPKDLQIESFSGLKVFDYQSSKDCLKQKVSLNQNTFSFLIEGKKEVFTDKSFVSIEKNNFLLMKKGNCLMTEKLLNPKNSYRSILLFFSDTLMSDFISKYKIKNVKQSQESVYSFKYDEFLTTFVSSLVDISKLHTKVQSKLLALKFEELMLYLQETKGTGFMFSLIAGIDDKRNRFIEIVEKNKLNKLTVKELSFLCNMSVSSFKREFEKHFHSSPSKWFQNKRLEYATFLLQNTSKRPSDIFEEIGYENLSSFINAFKVKFGITPKQYQLNLNF